MWEPANRVWDPGTRVWEQASRVWELASRVRVLKRDVWELSSHQLPLNLTPAHKLSILQLNQATFDLPGSAIIRPTHKPSCRSQNSFYKFRKKLILGVNNVRKILGFSRVRVRV